uniref:Uncharacterized protein n=1 Tax=Eptatretus burgeri TaxID=7764 RepID=A0A8C4QKU8_EPTBU
MRRRREGEKGRGREGDERNEERNGREVGMGMTTTCDTLLSQSFGSGNLKHVGVIMQRSVIILTILCILCLAVLINTELLLLALQQDLIVARLLQSTILPLSLLYLSPFLVDRGTKNK